MTTAAKFEAREVPLNEIHIWPDQPRPRTHFTPEKLAELEASVREDGLQTPINLRPRPSSDPRSTTRKR
jgi:ParB-like chromosome segregation protein Spo0J